MIELQMTQIRENVEKEYEYKILQAEEMAEVKLRQKEEETLKKVEKWLNKNKEL